MTWIIEDGEERNYGIFLAMECEWGNEQDVMNDFQKLLDASSLIKVLIFSSHGQPDNLLIGKLVESIRKHYKNSRDNYLLLNIQDSLIKCRIHSNGRSRRLFLYKLGQSHWV